MKLELAFKLGEAVFERNFTDNTAPFKGLGPAYLRSSCIDCHPGYGHGKRQTSYPSTYGNGYLLAIYHPLSDGSNDGAYISEVTGMPQTLASSPLPATCRRKSDKDRVGSTSRPWSRDCL